MNRYIVELARYDTNGIIGYSKDSYNILLSTEDFMKAREKFNNVKEALINDSNYECNLLGFENGEMHLIDTVFN